MYRIVRRTVHTITTVTWLIRFEADSLEQKYVEKEITFPASHSITEEDVLNTEKNPKRNRRLPRPILDEGENHE